MTPDELLEMTLRKAREADAAQEIDGQLPPDAARAAAQAAIKRAKAGEKRQGQRHKGWRRIGLIAAALLLTGGAAFWIFDGNAPRDTPTNAEMYANGAPVSPGSRSAGSTSERDSVGSNSAGTNSTDPGSPAPNGTAPSVTHPGGNAHLASRHTAPEQPTVSQASPTERLGDPSDIHLPTGDRILSSPGARYQIASTSPHRVIMLERGDALFSVSPVPGGSFLVQAGHTRVRVLGTVFSVLRQGNEVAVRVFEGRVEVDDAVADSRPRLLRRNEVWSSNASLLSDDWAQRAQTQWQEVAPERPTQARASVESRTTHEETVVPSQTPAPSADTETSPLEAARTLLFSSRTAEALQVANQALRTDPDHPGWLMIRADALRSQRQWRDAAESYRQAMQHLQGSRRAQAGFSAAQLFHHRLSDSAIALVCVQQSGAAEDGSPVEERGRALELELLRTLGNQGALERRAAAYRARFPARPSPVPQH